MYKIVRANKSGDVGNSHAGAIVESVLCSLELAVKEAEADGWTIAGGLQYVIRSGVGNHHFAMQAMVKNPDPFSDQIREMNKSEGITGLPMLADAAPQVDAAIPDKPATADASGEPTSIERPFEGTAAAANAWKTETPDIAKSLIAGTSAAFPQLSTKQTKKRNDKLAAAVQSVAETQTQED